VVVVNNTLLHPVPNYVRSMYYIHLPRTTIERYGRYDHPILISLSIYGTPVLGDDSPPPVNKIDWSATMQGTRLLVTWSLWAGSSSRANKPIPPVLALPRAQGRHRPRMGQEAKEARALLIPVL
jgi:hypothetical protein